VLRVTFFFHHSCKIETYNIDITIKLVKYYIRSGELVCRVVCNQSLKKKILVKRNNARLDNEIKMFLRAVARYIVLTTCQPFDTFAIGLSPLLYNNCYMQYLIILFTKSLFFYFYQFTPHYLIICILISIEPFLPAIRLSFTRFVDYVQINGLSRFGLSIKTVGMYQFIVGRRLTMYGGTPT